MQNLSRLGILRIRTVYVVKSQAIVAQIREKL